VATIGNHCWRLALDVLIEVVDSLDEVDGSGPCRGSAGILPRAALRHHDLGWQRKNDNPEALSSTI
jgi:hypothetical protein